jgi:hypothetical protein
MTRTATDEEIGRYHDEHVTPLLRGIPEDAVARMRARYIADVRANPEALRQVVEDDFTEVGFDARAGDVSMIPSHLLDQADILAKVGVVSREALYGLVATTWETAQGSVRDA